MGKVLQCVVRGVRQGPFDDGESSVGTRPSGRSSVVARLAWTLRFLLVTGLGLVNPELERVANEADMPFGVRSTISLSRRRYESAATRHECDQRAVALQPLPRRHNA
jgi:hypothetical protein